MGVCKHGARCYNVESNSVGGNLNDVSEALVFV